jgi:O-glycosyl hydrolase
VILQGINGFGAFGQAATIANVGSATQQQALDLLFSQATGPA